MPDFGYRRWLRSDNPVLRGGRREQRDPAPEEHRYDGRLDRVDEAGLEERAE